MNYSWKRGPLCTSVSWNWKLTSQPLIPDEAAKNQNSFPWNCGCYMATDHPTVMCLVWESGCGLMLVGTRLQENLLKGNQTQRSPFLSPLRPVLLESSCPLEAWLHPEALQDQPGLGPSFSCPVVEMSFIGLWNSRPIAPITVSTGNLLHFSVQIFVTNSWWPLTLLLYIVFRAFFAFQR